MEASKDMQPITQLREPMTIPLNSWLDAYNCGNTLLYLPREIRDKIYEDLAYTVCKARNDDRADITDESKFWIQDAEEKLSSLLPLSATCHQIRQEVVTAFVRSVKIVLRRSGDVLYIPFDVDVEYFFSQNCMQGPGNVHATFKWIHNLSPGTDAFRYVRSISVHQSVLFEVVMAHVKVLTNWAERPSLAKSGMHELSELPKLKKLSLVARFPDRDLQDAAEAIVDDTGKFLYDETCMSIVGLLKEEFPLQGKKVTVDFKVYYLSTNLYWP